MCFLFSFALFRKKCSKTILGFSPKEKKGDECLIHLLRKGGRKYGKMENCASNIYICIYICTVG